MAQNRRRGPIGGLFGLVGQGVGMASEYRAHRKELKEARSASQQQDGLEEPSRDEQGLPPAYGKSSQSNAARPSDGKDTALSEDQYEDDSYSSDSVSVVDDLEVWELDDAIESTDDKGLPTYEESEASIGHETTDDLVQDVIGIAPRTTQSGKPFVPQPLSFPVILPQRRPRRKTRGFVRAYAPDLDNCGIEQVTFLRFLENFDKSSQASSVFGVIKLAAGIAGMAPSVIAMAVTTAVQVAASVGEEVQGRMRTNNFLDRMNAKLFKPAGLFAMIVKYKTDAEVQAAASRQQGLVGGLASMVTSEKVDLSTNQVIAKYNPLPSGEGKPSMSDRMKDLRLASDTTHSTFELPESAPLIFPAIDQKMTSEGPETFKDKTKDAKKFLADYLDRRAQVQYANQDPHSSLAVPEDQRVFQSSLADPSHPMHQGGLVTLLSGGRVAPRERRGGRGRRRRDRNRYADEDYEEVASRSSGRFGGGVDATHHTPALAGRSLGESSAPMTHPPSIGTRGANGARRDVYSARRGFDAGTYGRGEIGRRDRSGGRRERRKQGGGPIGAVKRVIREDVLYLLIVNMPSEEELARAREELGSAHAR